MHLSRCWEQGCGLKILRFGMNKFIALIGLFLLTATYTFAQKADGSIKSLINIDEKVNYAVFREGIANSFLKYGSEGAIIFTPQPQPFSKVFTKSKEKSDSG